MVLSRGTINACGSTAYGFLHRGNVAGDPPLRFVPWRGTWGGLYTFLRNEPILFRSTFRCINFIYRNLCRLQRRLQMGSFWKNEPILRDFMGGPDAPETKTNPNSPSRFALSADKTAGQLAGTVGRLMAGQTRCVFYNVRALARVLRKAPL